MPNPIPPWEYRRKQGRRLGQGGCGVPGAFGSRIHDPLLGTALCPSRISHSRDKFSPQRMTPIQEKITPRIPCNEGFLFGKTL
jgi:hypothetical protein